MVSCHVSYTFLHTLGLQPTPYLVVELTGAFFHQKAASIESSQVENRLSLPVMEYASLHIATFGKTKPPLYWPFGFAHRAVNSPGPRFSHSRTSYVCVVKVNWDRLGTCETQEVNNYLSLRCLSARGDGSSPSLDMDCFHVNRSSIDDGAKSVLPSRLR
ncbi:hypothetical protein J3458_001582 [Metarhizium acridum]|uniref:uncharacterized protein n=1 Tax=Metarhizium acridum TaxID=92637 RepID=UPI001C6CEFC0|nr:hypothetical protein J3458_001582 [Metarhizium acridum]